MQPILRLHQYSDTWGLRTSALNGHASEPYARSTLTAAAFIRLLIGNRMTFHRCNRHFCMNENTSFDIRRADGSSYLLNTRSYTLIHGTNKIGYERRQLSRLPRYICFPQWSLMLREWRVGDHTITTRKFGFKFSFLLNSFWINIFFIPKCR